MDYDAWYDLNDDGIIDMTDIGLLCLKYGTTGTPINKTALLLELMEKIEILNATIIAQQNTINYLNETVIYLNETMTILNSTGLGAPNYDSGWVALNIYHNFFTHNLGTTNAFVYIQGKYYDGTIHQVYYGGEYIGDIPYGERLGVWWSVFTTTSLLIYREPNDTDWYYARVMIWKIPEP